ncbi:MAG TPA: hypothetical protein VJ598_05365, partial [Albitalea sp.]|nr:hypothetical protein [Albitalea sp.]
PPATSGVSPEVQADALVKIYTMALAQGVARVYWFSPRDSEGMSFGLSATDGTPRASHAALRSLAGTLGARPRFLGWAQPGGAHYGFVFGTAQTTVLAAWARTGQTSTLNFASLVTVIDPRSGTTRSATTLRLTDVPVLLVAPVASAQAQQWQRDAAASVGKAFPWYGDHRNAASVSLTAGSDPQGVFMVNAPAASVVNGVAEFDLEGRSGAKFSVDPSFLSYTTTPIRITLVLRAHGTGDPGFNLRYESNAPLSRTDGNGLIASSSGWHHVGSTSFYTKTWAIADPRFVGLYGYNFYLDTDGPTHSQFSIRQITVSKP